jgi:hypothetical protein
MIDSSKSMDKGVFSRGTRWCNRNDGFVKGRYRTGKPVVKNGKFSPQNGVDDQLDETTG